MTLQSNIRSHLRIRFSPPLVSLHETEVLLDFYDKFLRTLILYSTFDVLVFVESREKPTSGRILNKNEQARRKEE